MKTAAVLIKRNIKLFFKDKGMFFTSLVTPAILLILYATFLSGIYRDSFVSSIPDTVTVADDIIDGLVGGQLMSSKRENGRRLSCSYGAVLRLWYRVLTGGRRHVFSGIRSLIFLRPLRLRRKSFGEVKAVQDLTIEVRSGELFAFLGVNGAGKSTTINILCGQLPKDSGSVIIDGQDLDKNPDLIKMELGVVFQNSVLDGALTVCDNLQSRAALYGITGAEFKTRLYELAEILDFKELLKRTAGKLSGGQRRRIDVARALFHRPKILVLDEPATGLDPHTRKMLWNVISDLRKNENMTVFLTTHYMEEAADADYVVILDGGKIAAEGTPLELKNTYTGCFYLIFFC